MGEIAGTMTKKKKKKKGRPSLLDLQKRSLKQQQHQQNPNFKNLNSLNAFPPTPHRRSTRRNPNTSSDDNDEHEDDDDERKEKKQKLLLGLSSQQNNHFPDSYGDTTEVGFKRNKISAPCFGSDEMDDKPLKATDTFHESPVVPGPTTPLPDKKLLVFILDRLQKKDTYGVFSDPVAPEELPDYHEIIENPMDFSTVRKKLDEKAYANLELFEKDVFLICSNAMQYNSPDTIYFRQARSMLELAKRDFENLRQDSDDGGEPQPKIVRRGRLPGKLKKPVEKSHLDRVAPECSSDATLASAGDNTNSSTGYNLRKTYSYKYQPADVMVRTSHGSYGSDAYSTWMSEWENEFPASVLKAVLKYGKKPYAVDENKRDTYKNSFDSMNGPSNLNIFEGELKQLIAVGIHSEHGYARSLARFVVDVGPVVRRIASKKIESVLPKGVDYGPGWVGDGQQQFQFSDRPNVSSNSLPNHPSGRLQSPYSTGSNPAVRSNSWARGEEDMETVGGLGSQSKFSGTNPMSSVLVQQNPAIQSDVNGFSYNNLSHLIRTARPGTQTGKSGTEAFGMVSTSNPTFCPVPGNDFSLNKANFSENLSGLPCNGTYALDSSRQPECIHFPPDLNIGFLGSHSPSSRVPIGSPQQPDLALQL